MTPMLAAISGIDQFVVSFQSIVYEALPFVIIGALISGILEELLPQQLFARMIPKNRTLAIAGSASLGLIFPMCECGIVPVMRRLLGKGLPLGCAVAYMLAAPVVNPVVIASTWAAFSGDRSNIDGITSAQMVVLRCGLAFITAFIIGSVVNRLSAQGVGQFIKVPIKTISLTMTESQEKTASLSERLTNIAQVALHDFIDITCFLILGAILAASLQTYDLVNKVSFLFGNPWSATLTMMAIAVLLCLCSEADAFVAANMTSVKFLSGKLGFLVLGPMFDLKLLLMFTRVFKARLIVIIVILLWVIVFSLSMMTYYLHEYARALATTR